MIRTFIAVFTLLFSYTTMAQSGDIESIEKSLSNRDDIVFYGSFDNGFNNSEWESGWGIQWDNRASACEIISNSFNGSKALRVNYPKGGVGPGETGAQFPIVLRDMKNNNEGHYNELYLRYYVKFEEGFDFNKGGKLPGLMGGGDSWSRSGGNQPDGTNGWTLRFMWRSGGELVVYAYVPKSENGKWGAEVWGQDITTNVEAQPGEWHCIEEYVNIGTAGNDDGRLKVWVDGEQKIDIDDMRFWNEENDNGKIGGVYFSTFHGGNSEDWAPANDSYAQFDGFVLAKNRVGVYEESSFSEALNSIQPENLNIYRNPSSGNYIVEFSNQESGIAQLKVFSLSGQRLKTVDKFFQAGEKCTIEVDLDLIQNELYLFRFTNDGRSRVVKMIH
ncbi:MAG: T9SS type A sorting domain-containing protein [Prolixibacteraceae bacterium]|jgi:hypothetical protein|nr:T9SS type A sorting domain-containing protein [Prolixibacteraceae bacterium]